MAYLCIRDHIQMVIVSRRSWLEGVNVVSSSCQASYRKLQVWKFGYMQSAFCQHHGPFIGSTSCNVYVCHHVMVNLVCMCVWRERERERERERQWTYPLWSRFHRSKYPMARYLSFMCLHIFYIIPKFSFRFGRVLNLLTLNSRYRSNECDMIERTEIILLK